MKKFFLFFFIICFSVPVFAQKKWTLRECVNYALENNLQVLSNQYNKKSQDNNLKIAKKQKLPGVSGSLGNSVSFGQQRALDIIQRNDYFNNSANVNADVLLYNNGRLEKNIRKTEFDVEASNYDLEKIKNDISVQVAQQYLNIMLNREIVKINESALKNAQKLYEKAKITTSVGTTAQTVLAESEAALAREKQNLKTSEVNTKQSIFNLAQLLRIVDYTNFDVENVTVEQQLPAPLFTIEDFINKAYETQPAIKAAQSRIKSSETQTQITKTAFYPTITVSAGVGTFYFNSFNNNRFEYSFFRQYADNFGQQAALNLNIPIFNKGITKLQVEQSKINEDIARNNLDIQKQTVLQNVQQAHFSALSNYEIYQAALEAEKSSALSLDFANKSYAAGRTSIYDLNIARNNYANAQGSVAQAKYNYIFSLKLLNFYAGIPIID